METRQSLEQAAQEYQEKIDAEMSKPEPNESLVELWTVKRDALQYRAVYATDERDAQ